MSIKLLTQTEVSEAIPALATNAANVQATIHQIGCSILEHTRQHGDYTGAERLCNALPRGQRVKALAFWFRHFSNGKLTLAVAKDTKMWVGKLAKDRDFADFDVDSAMETTFADLTSEKDPTTLTLEKFIKGLERTANNDATFDGTSIPKVAPEARAVAATLVAAYRSMTAKAA